MCKIHPIVNNITYSSNRHFHNFFSSDSSRGDKCLLPYDRGFCLAIIIRWWMNPSTGECEIFYYGGCGGNANSFSTKEECERECAHVKNEIRKGSISTPPYAIPDN